MHKCLFRNKRTQLFVLILFISTFLEWCFVIYTKGDSLTNYFIPDIHDSFMDYYNMLANSFNDNVYEQYSNYPAGALLIWDFLNKWIPSGEEITDGFFLRDYMPAVLGYIFYCVLSIIVCYELLKWKLCENNYAKAIFAIVIMISGPVIFLFERGNVLFLTWILAMIYVFNYDSPKLSIRLLAYFALAIASAIKIYPCIFGILTVIQKRYKETLALLILGICSFFVPFFFYNGIESISAMFKGLTLSFDNSVQVGMGYNYSMNNIINIICNISGNPIFTHEFVILSLLISLLIGGCIFYFNEERWKKIYALTLLMIWVPSFSYTYTLIFFVIPLIFYLNECQRKKDIVFIFVFAFILAPHFSGECSFVFQEKYIYKVTYGTLLGNIAIVIGGIYLLISGMHSYFYIKNVKEK